MESLTNHLQNPKLQTEPQLTNSEKFAHSDDVFIWVWRGLQSGKFLTASEVVGGTEYKYWRQNLKDMTDKHLQLGLRATGQWDGKAYCMTWADFRKLCIQAHWTSTEQSRQAEPPTTSRLADMSSFGRSARWEEMSKVTTAMLAETGKGPITRATLDNRLTANVVRGKSADEIIDYCRKLYGD